MSNLEDLMSEKFDMRPSFAAAWSEYLTSLGDVSPERFRHGGRIIAMALDTLQTELECLLEDLGTAEQSAVEGLMARINRIEAVIEKAGRS